MFTFKALEGTTSQTLRDRESTENASGQHVSSSHRGNVENQTNGGSGAASRMAGSFRYGNAHRLEREEAARRAADERAQREAERVAEIQAINAERALRGLGPARGAGLEGEIQRRAMLRRDAQIGKQLEADMGTSLGYEKFTKAGTLRSEFK
jgi:hypothetical protein